MNLTKKNVKEIMKLIIFAGIILWIVFNYKLFIDFIQFLFRLLLPIIVGVCIAFILNVPMKMIERKLFKIDKRKHKKLIRGISLTLSIILIFGIIALIMFLVIPEFISAISAISKNLPKNVEWLNEIADKLANLYPDIKGYFKSFDFNTIINNSFLSASNIISTMIGFLSSLVSRVITFCIGFILSIYILIDKEKLARQTKKLLNAFFSNEVTNEVVRVVKLTNNTFTNFLTGQCLDAVLFSILFFICMTVLGMPYALIISVLLAVTALIPYIGAFITLVIGAILIAVTDPIKSLWYVILFLVLQQVDGNLMYPKIVGKSVGLPAIWALVAALIGGSVFGFIGMIISIPISSILYTILREWINERIRKKQRLKS